MPFRQGLRRVHLTETQDKRGAKMPQPLVAEHGCGSEPDEKVNVKLQSAMSFKDAVFLHAHRSNHRNRSLGGLPISRR